jgi:hypothetical protein
VVLCGNPHHPGPGGCAQLDYDSAGVGIPHDHRGPVGRRQMLRRAGGREKVRWLFADGPRAQRWPAGATSSPSCDDSCFSHNALTVPPLRSVPAEGSPCSLANAAATLRRVLQRFVAEVLLSAPSRFRAAAGRFALLDPCPCEGHPGCLRWGLFPVGAVVSASPEISQCRAPRGLHVCGSRRKCVVASSEARRRGVSVFGPA